jgi:hypothetical protein
VGIVEGIVVGLGGISESLVGIVRGVVADIDAGILVGLIGIAIDIGVGLMDILVNLIVIEVGLIGIVKGIGIGLVGIGLLPDWELVSGPASGTKEGRFVLESSQETCWATGIC